MMIYSELFTGILIGRKKIMKGCMKMSNGSGGGGLSFGGIVLAVIVGMPIFTILG